MHSQTADHGSSLHKVTAAGILVSIGIVFGDIGTSPLYAFGAIVGERPISEALVLGGLSCIFWTLTLLTTVKYVIITLNADNRGEGGVFSLYALVRRFKKWLLYPAIIGGSFLLADGIITPPISVSSAIEGLKIFNAELDTVPIVIAILILLFIVQQLGTNLIGKAFGPIMLVWFSFLAAVGAASILENPLILKAINPVYAYELLTGYPEGFWLLGAVFLCTTGAEALYSDMGHCGRNNIRVSWAFVKVALLLNYAGQGAWLLNHIGSTMHGARPFYQIVPQQLLLPSIGLATLAAIIASQALISGSFTLVSEAMRLNLWPKLRIIYPTNYRGQLYIPMINWMLMIGCIGVVLYFEESEKMEAAYGLAVTLTMMMTSLLIASYLLIKWKTKRSWAIILITSIFLSIEVSFLIANATKFKEGGFVSILFGFALVIMMLIWYRARALKDKLVVYEQLDKVMADLKQLSSDLTIPKYATHLVYLTASNSPDKIESKILYSIFQRAPKRADVYWFLHINVVDEPYQLSYKADILAEDDVVWITFNLGFRIEPRINMYFRLVVEQLVRNNEIDIKSRYASLSGKNMAGDFRFVILESFLSYENKLSWLDRLTMNGYYYLSRFSLNDKRSFGLDTSNVTVEKTPLVVNQNKDVVLLREY